MQGRHARPAVPAAGLAQAIHMVYDLCVAGAIEPEVIQILRDLNPWWSAPRRVRPEPPPYRRRHVLEIGRALHAKRALIQVLRGPRQVGKTTALYQLVEDLLKADARPENVFLIRFDLDPLREAGLLSLARWYAREVRRQDLREGDPALLLLDEVHKLDRWDEVVKHVYDTFRVRIVLTGSSSVLVARGQRESLAGRAITVDFPPFLFREVLESWHSEALEHLPAPVTCTDLFRPVRTTADLFRAIHGQPAQRKHSWRRRLERYYNRGGYPRLHSGEVDEDRWADYLVETVFERVLGVDVPDLFPVDQPRLLRHVYLEIARRTGTEVSQGALAQACNAAGFRTSQVVVGRYLHYLADALLLREFRRYPLARTRAARVPVKITLTDLGVRNAIFRGAPSLWESPPDVVGPLVETLVQSVLRGPNLQVHFYRDYSVPDDRRSPIEEVDFVLEAIDGRVIPVEVKFRKNVQPDDERALRSFMRRFGASFGILVTRDTFRCEENDPVLLVPLLDLLLAF